MGKNKQKPNLFSRIDEHWVFWAEGVGRELRAVGLEDSDGYEGVGATPTSSMPGRGTARPLLSPAFSSDTATAAHRHS